MNLLKLKDVAIALQIDEETVRKYLRSGRLKGYKLAGWLWRVKEEDLKEFIEKYAAEKQIETS